MALHSEPMQQVCGRRAGRVDSGLLGAALSGVLYALAQPNWGFWPLAAVCMVPLFRGLQGASLRRRIGLAYLSGTLAAGIATAVSGAVGAVAYFGLPVWAGALAALAAGQLFGAGSFVLFALLAGDPSRHHPALAALRVGAAWAAAELMRSVLFTGLPWLLFAYTLVPVPQLAQSAAIGGALFVSLWLAAFNAALSLALRAQGRRAAFATATLIVAGVAGLDLTWAGTSPHTSHDAPGPGSIRVDSAALPGKSDAVRVLIVQSGVPNEWRGSSPGAVRAVEQLVRLSQVEPTPDLILWPENALSALLPFNQDLLRRGLAPLGSSVPHLIIGAPRSDPDVPGRLLTAAFLLGPERQVLGYHDKVHLLPFAEYMPWPLSALGFGGRQTHAGSGPTMLEAGSVAVGPLLCYEILFPELSRKLVLDGAEILVNLSNDAWFGTTGAVEQHLAGAVFRAIETQRPMLRSTNTGITVAIDARGRIVARLEMNRPGSLAVTVRPGAGLTPYVRMGDVAAWSALVLTGAASLVEFAAARRRRRGTDRVRGRVES